MEIRVESDGHLLRVSAPEFDADFEVYGQCPVQGFGAVLGRDLYFRARHTEWTFDIANESGGLPSDGNSGGFFREGEHPNASYMALDHAVRIIASCLEEFTGVVAWTGPPEAPGRQAGVTLIEYLQRLQASGLIEPAGIDFQLERFQNLSRGPADDAAAFARLLIHAKLLTPWQHNRLWEGRTKGFHVGPYTLLEPLTLIESGQYLAVGEDAVENVVLRLRDRPAAGYEDIPTAQQLAEPLSQVHSPFVLRTVGGGAVADQSWEYLVEEHWPAHSLFEVVERDGALDPPRVARVLADAARGFEAIAGAGITHLDVTPTQILLDHADQVKVRGLSSRGWEIPSRSLSTPYTEATLGSVDYLSPEDATGTGMHDARSDVYSLGCVLYFALVGHPPFPRGTLADRLMQHLNAPAPFPLSHLRRARSTRLTSVPDGLEGLCRRMLAKDPAERPQNLAAVVQTLSALPR